MVVKRVIPKLIILAFEIIFLYILYLNRIKYRGDRTMYERLLPYIDTIISCFKEFEYKWKFLIELPTLDLSC